MKIALISQNTTTFCQRWDKFSEFHVDKFTWAFPPDPEYPGATEGDKIVTFSKLEFTSAGCTVNISTKQNNFTGESFAGTIKILSGSYDTETSTTLNLSLTSSAKSDIFAYIGPSKTMDGKPLFSVNINGNKIGQSSHISAKKIVTTSVDDEYSIPVKSKEYATRLANAFEHAVQLCGGGKEIGKKELF